MYGIFSKFSTPRFQVLNEQKMLFKKTISDLSEEFNTVDCNHEKEISQLTQERDILSNELSLLNKTRSTLEEKIEEMSRSNEELTQKFNELERQMKNKVSKKFP